jgi:two-component system NtrC family response regulator
VEDDEATHRQLDLALKEEFDLLIARDPAEALALARDHHPTLILLDLGLPPRPADPEVGLRLLREIRKWQNNARIIVCTDCGERQHAVRAVSDGAYDFFRRPVDLKLLQQLMQRLCWVAELEEDRLTLLPEPEDDIEEMIGTSEKIHRVFAAIRKVATTEVPVLIIGESGTGKELAAKAIHERSCRKEGPFVTINCGAIPETLLESELFGHERGAFTGAVQQKKGKLEYAQGGTIFLDEIGELPLALQVKLLRFLEDHTIERVGGWQRIFVDARIIAATHVDLLEAIAHGKFREDLYYRVGVVTLDLPPLRNRGEDVLLMAIAFLRRATQQSRKRVLGFTKGAIGAIQAYPWPGNVRELSNRIRRAIVMAEGPYVTPEDLDLPTPGGSTSPAALSLKTARQRVEADLILRAALIHQGNLSRVAEELGISRPNLYVLLRKHHLQVTANNLKRVSGGKC